MMTDFKIIIYLSFVIICIIKHSITQDCIWGDSSTGGPNNSANTNHKSFLVVDQRIDCWGKISGWSFRTQSLYPKSTCDPVVYQVYRPVDSGYMLVGEHELAPPIPCPICADSGWSVGLNPATLGGSDAFTGTRTFILHEYGIINCYGVIERWTFRKSKNACGVSAEIMFQVWRRMEDGKNYELIGEESYLPINCDPGVYTQSAREEINVLPGDVIGWSQKTSTVGVMVVKYTQSGTSSLVEFNNCWNLAPGDNTADCTDATMVIDQKDFLLQANVTIAADYDEYQVLNVVDGLKLPVQQGDLIGWTDTVTSDIRTFEYTEGLPGSNNVQVVHILENECRVPGNEDCDWTGAKVVGRDYALEAVIEQGDPPFINNLDASTKVAENRPAGTEVYKVIGSNDRNWNDIVHSNFIYSLVDNPAEFEIDPVTGIISTTTELDYETTPQFQFILEVQVYQDLRNISTGILTVNVTDENEPHTITELPDTVVIDAATTKANDRIYGPITIKDEDTPASWEVKEYLMVNENPAADLFRIQSHDPNPSEARVYSKVDLSNWQGATVVVLHISATDGYHTTDPLTLTIIITNIWLPPYLINVPNVVTLPENTAYNTLIYDVNGARDPRRGIGPTYKIIKVSPAKIEPDAWNPFDINENTGEVSYIGSPNFDYMDIRKYEIEIIANDSTYISPAENLTVEITWVNQAPDFVDNPAFYYSVIPELSPIGTTLPGVIIESSDRDSPLGDWTDYILSGRGDHLFKASNITHKVKTNDELICQPGQSMVNYSLTITVHDSSGATDNSGELYITVTDVNDHAPQFTSDYYEGEIYESDGAGTAVVTVEVTDDDAGENARVWFVVLEEYARLYFEVDQTCTSGRCDIINKQPINCTEFRSINFTLVAFDHGIPSLNSSATVFVNIIDENDNPPEFVQEYCNTEILTDLGIMSEVHKVEIYDPDIDDNSNVSFGLLIPEKGFMMEELTGIIRNKDELQAYKTHILYAYARDWSDPEHYSDPAIVRLDTYTGKHHLVDIHMELPLKDFIGMKDEFLKRLNEKILPWYAKEEKKLLYPDQSILTIYALKEKPPESLDKLDHTKIFIERNPLLAKLRVNIQGKPKDWLRGEEFAEYQVFKVLPTYPVWLIDTIGGIVTLTLLCLLFVAFWVFICCMLQKRCKKNKVVPDTFPGKVDEFELRYGNYTHVPFPKEAPIIGKKKKGVLPSPLLPALPEKPENTASEGNYFTAKPVKDPVSELPPNETITKSSIMPNKPLPPSGRNRRF